MLVSVFNWNTLDFDYYQTKDNSDYGGWFELQGLGIAKSSKESGVGIDIEDALPSLPNDAVYVGSGSVAKGRICVKRSEGLQNEMSSSRQGQSSIMSNGGRGLSGTIFGGRLVNLQTLPAKDRIKFHQDRNRHLLDYSGPNFLQVYPKSHEPSSNLTRTNEDMMKLYGLAGLGEPLKEEDVSSGNQENTENEKVECKKEIPLALFLVPVLAGTTAGYLLASRDKDLSKSWSVGLGFLAGITAGIALGREYEGYKMATIQSSK
jgi:hypothetical protein